MRSSWLHSERGPGPRPGRSGRLVAVLILVCAPASGERRTLGTEPLPATEGVSELVAGSLAAETFDPLRLRASLEELGGQAVPELLLLLARGEVALGSTARTLDYGHELVVAAALCREPGMLRGHLEQLVNSGAEEQVRVTGMRMLARCGVSSDVMLLLRLAPRSDRQPVVNRTVQVALIEALTTLERRQPRALGRLIRLFPGIPRGVLPGVVGYLARHPSGAGATHLVDLLDVVPDADELILLHLDRLVRESAVEIPEAQRPAVRAFLENADPDLVSFAASILGSTRDHAAVPRLIELLDQRSGLGPGPRQVILAALEQLAGCRPGLDRSSWERWFELEQIWRNEKAPALAQAVRSGTPEAAVQAIRELCDHRMYADGAVAALLPGLARREVEVVRLTCAALLQLGSAAAVPGLLDGLQHADLEVRSLAHRALENLTGLNLPPDRATWDAFLARR